MRYAAFISYSHQDRKVAKWLHRAIETYRIPRDLTRDGSDEGGDGAQAPRISPTALRPIFRDDDELGGAAELGPKLEAALSAAEALIVVCSPAAAASRWVDKEIRTFRMKHPEAPVLAVIAHGQRGDPNAECFPEALCWGINRDGSLDRNSPIEPLAPDLQKAAKATVKLKLIAGLLGVGYSKLTRREARRRQRFLIFACSAAAVLLVILSGLTITAITSAREAIRERNAAIAARDLAERRAWLAQQAASQIRSFAADADCTVSQEAN
ncbi:MAG: TIR domain-containing protein [Novosphingobium sp.]